MQATLDNKLHPGVLHIDCEVASSAICRRLVEIVAKELRRRGVVVALSGGVDSSVCAALAVKALGVNKVFGLLLPEADSSSMSKDLGRRVAESLRIQYLEQNITETLTAIGCYKWRDEAIRSVFPDYKEDWKSKLVIAGGADGRFNFFNLVVQSPDGAIHERRLQYKEYLQIVAATNYKQRIRKTMEYFHADRLHYAVVGTPNRLEYDQGFFVKNGDGSADVKPIVHLYKTQVYALARYFKLPPEIYHAKPTTDTYSLPQGQDEFYFTLPYQQMDLALWAHHHQLPAQALATALDIDKARAGFIYRDIEAKRRAARYLHARPMLIEEVASP
jgi:NAD+ synthase